MYNRISFGEGSQRKLGSRISRVLDSTCSKEVGCREWTDLMGKM